MVPGLLGSFVPLFCFFVSLCGCDFPLAHFWSIRVMCSTEEIHSSKRYLHTGTQSKLLAF